MRYHPPFIKLVCISSHLWTGPRHFIVRDITNTLISYSCLRKHCFCQKMLKAEIHCMLFRIFKSQSNVQNFGSKFSNTIFLLTPINEGNLVKIGPFEHPQLSNAIWPKSIRVSQMCVQTVGISWVLIPYYNVALDQSLLNSPSLSLLERNIYVL